MAAKKMKTRAVLLCDECEVPILKREDGFVLYGAISEADTESEPILGEAFPTTPSIAVGDLSTKAYCRTCFCKKLGLTSAARRPPVAATTESSFEEPAPAVSTGPAPSYAEDVGFEVDNPLGTVAAPPPVPGAPRTINVGATKQVAPGAHVNAGVGVLPKNASKLPVIPGQINRGDVVRVNERHPHYESLRGRAATVERFREDDKDYVIRFAGGQPMVAKGGQLDRLISA